MTRRGESVLVAIVAGALMLGASALTTGVAPGASAGVLTLTPGIAQTIATDATRFPTRFATYRAGRLSATATSSSTPMATLSVPPTATAVTSATVYQVSNPNPVALSVQHVFSNGYVFFGDVGAESTATYAVADMQQIPTGFVGTVQLYAMLPFTASVVSS